MNRVLAFLTGVAAGWLFKQKCTPRRLSPPDCPPPLDCPPPYCPPPKVPDTLDESGLASQLGVRLAGTPADGSAAPAAAPKKAIWVEGGDEVLVHLDSLTTRILDRMVLVSLDMETDQTGRTPLIVALALGTSGDPAGLVAVTDELPRGNGLLASRWGASAQAAVWASMLGIANDHATERAASPRGISAAPGLVTLQAGPRLAVA